MNRLTKKFEDNSGYEPIENHNVCNITLYDFNFDDYDRCVDKLGRLEDLEEELGCPLEVLVKALTEGIYCVDYDDQKIKKFHPNLCFNSTSKQLYWYGNVIGYPDLKDYQKTWWLKGEK